MSMSDDSVSDKETGTESTSVLVVDDEEGLADLFTAILEKEYDVRTANSGPDALEIVDDAVDVVLLDRRMPDVSGDEVLAELRERGFDCQVAMLTAVQPDTDIVDMAVDDYLIKPVDRNDLFGVVETLVRRSTYDDHSQRYFSLASKKAALELADNDDTEEYEELVGEMTALRDEMETTLDEISAEDAFTELFAD
jgi:DNA-binding response OmpR family regulator